jgi:bifunctional DNA-binding transcriptional regulator/antitoxin component of YhaV-PrlF toxin-antitoxin module
MRALMRNRMWSSTSTVSWRDRDLWRQPVRLLYRVRRFRSAVEPNLRPPLISDSPYNACRFVLVAARCSCIVSRVGRNSVGGLCHGVTMSSLTAVALTDPADVSTLSTCQYVVGRDGDLMSITQEVRVTRSGNTQAFPVPAAIARSLGLEPGDSFEIQVFGESVLYRRAGVKSAVVHSGEGSDRYFVPAHGRTAFMTEARSSPLLDDWEF